MREAKARALNICRFSANCATAERPFGIALHLTMMEIETPGKRKVWRDRTVAKTFEYAGERNPGPRSS
jgi:hypothetical protein